jgi:myo-inositol-1(or 4)-monophosphatase
MGKYSPYLEAAKDVAVKAGELIRKSYYQAGKVFFKGEINLVTKTDISSQDLIFGRLAKEFPDHDFLAEEGLRKLTGAEFRWVFDPLDGTTNFAHRFPVFSVSIGLEHRGRLVCGVVFNPMSGEMFSAERGRSAHLDGKRIHVSATADLGRGLLATGFPYDVRETKTNIANHERFLLKAQGVRRCGSVALDLCFIACGRFDGFWEMKLNPWDIAAGVVIAEEAGGIVTDFEGRPVDIYRPEIVASNGRIHRSMLEVLSIK